MFYNLQLHVKKVSILKFIYMLTNVFGLRSTNVVGFFSSNVSVKKLSLLLSYNGEILFDYPKNAQIDE